MQCEHYRRVPEEGAGHACRVRAHAGCSTTASASASSGGGARVGGASGGSVGDNGTLELVATARGAMAHRPDCVVVAGKAGVRAVDADDGLAPCKLCDPYTDPVPAD